MAGTAAVSGVGAASQWLIMVILGIPLALPVAVLSFILCFIPYLGGFLSTGIAFLLTIAYGSPLDVLVMGIWTIVFNIVQGNIVSPLVYGRTVSLHPAVVLLAIPAAAAVAGIVGMFLVVPALGVVAATWRPVLRLLGDPDGDALDGSTGGPTAPAVTTS
jgi:predicted PurR-regulated permease PerM